MNVCMAYILSNNNIFYNRFYHNNLAMKIKILEHHVVIRVDEEKNPVLCLEIAYSDTLGKHQWGFIKDLPEDFKDEHIPNYLKTFIKWVEETEKKKKTKEKKQKLLFQQYREMQKALEKTKHDPESLKKAIKEYNELHG